VKNVWVNILMPSRYLRSISPWQRGRSPGGFTLIELLLALSIFSMVAVMVYSTFMSGMQISRRSEHQNEMYRQARIALDLMTHELENRASYDFSQSYPQRSDFFSVQGGLSFLVPGKDGLKAVTYYLLSSENDHIHKVIIGQTFKKNVDMNSSLVSVYDTRYLVREERSFNDYVKFDRLGIGEIEILAVNVKKNGLRFRYGYHNQEGGSRFIWTDILKEGVLPSSIHVEVDFLAPEFEQGYQTFSRKIILPRGLYQENQSTVKLSAI